MKALSLIAVLLLASALIAAEDGKETKDSKPVTDVDVKGLALPANRGRPSEPTAVIADAAALEKTFENERVRKAILDQVDLKTHTLIYFAWSGSGQDQVLSTVVKNEEKIEVRFVYRPGRTRDLRQHHRMFAVRKGTEWKMEGNARER